MLNFRQTSFIIILFVFILVLPKFTAAQVIDSIYHDWVVYEKTQDDQIYDEDGEEEEGKICYIVSFPKDSVTSYSANRQPYISITHFASSKIEEVSIYGGYEYKINSYIYVLIDDQQFELFTNGDMAWAKNQEQDKNLIQLMLRAGSIKVRSDSAIGNYAIDQYSVKGLVKAYARMKYLCR